MKKFIFMMIAMFTAITMNAQDQSNYTGSSKFTDNVSVTLQGGVLTTFNDFYTGHTMMAPVAVLGVDKYVNPWFGVGVEARTLIGTGKVGEARFNSKTVFDAVNVSGYAKFNIMNMINFDGTRKFFEPVVYTGLGWGHNTAEQYSYMTYRAGAELNFNLGKEKAWAVVVNPSVVWGDYPANGALCKSAGNFEVTAGIVYHFKTSNGTRTFTKAKLYDAAEVARLNDKINELENRPVKVIEKIVEAPVAKNAAAVVPTTYVVPFTFNSAELSDNAKVILDAITTDTTVDIDSYASVEPKSNAAYNQSLTENRAAAVKAYLESKGVKVADTRAHGMDDNFGRVAVVKIK